MFSVRANLIIRRKTCNAAGGKRCGSMLEFTWKLFSQTGNIDTYLLFKELEREQQFSSNEQKVELEEIDQPIF
jgi:hypothetical protein